MTETNLSSIYIVYSLTKVNSQFQLDKSGF